MNPFAKTASGLFIVVGPRSDSALIAERICAGLILKLEQGPAHILDAKAWQDAVQMVPNLVAGASASQKLNQTLRLDSLATTIAEICSGPYNSEQAPIDLTTSITSYLNTYGRPSSFNCLIVDQAEPIQIHMRLTCLSITNGAEPDNFGITSSLFSASLNLSTKQMLSELAQVFDRFSPPKNQPYYLRVIR
ncbi:glutamate acetyltransferase (plasmid) [Rhizobium lusitanum]|uniref:glutamate acetyltransferase n=1 Tax=Rhizobium lusitanum TaxID=293958 RepID=UPI00160CC4DD|nr:glutamate acetyltransferase [Rhizobium lusitanum]QND44360.1 glutamate acetyltransferase [Rhizobium lusitanum]